jgi:enoyl-CoA hydratase/carnithine racemase
VSTDVSTTITDHVATVEIHRPPHNWFDVEVLRGLADSVLALDDEPDARAIVLCSEGRNFCAGADLSGSDVIESTSELYASAVRLFSNRKPIVAAVQGAAVGGGFGLTLAADFRVATPQTRFSCNFAKLAFHQGFGISIMLPRVVGQQRALELMLVGADVRGEEALRIGLVDRIAPIEELRGAAHAYAAEIAANGPLGVQAIRQTLRGDLGALVAEATRHEEEQQTRLRATADFAEGVAATSERRPPNFTGR